MYRSNKIIAYGGLYIAFCTVIGFMLAPVPNVELIILMVFIGGYLFGPGTGILVGAASGSLFSALNPWGSGLAFPPLLFAQTLCFAITGLSGGIAVPLILRRAHAGTKMLLFGMSGLILTVLYHLIVSFFTTGYAGFTMSQIGVFLVGGMVFGLWHIGMNTIFFAFLTPVLIRVIHQMPFVLELNKPENRQ
jgi:hypothetical protein